MRNYKLNTIKGFGALSSKNELRKEQHNALINRGYNFSELFRQYRKIACPFIDIIIDLDRGELLFYNNRFFMPCELNHYVKDKSMEMKQIQDEVRWLKTNGYFIQKK